MASTKLRKNTRQKIIECALECFSDEGVMNTTISKIAARAKIPHTLLLYHFPSMEALYYETMLLALDHLRELSVDAIEKNIKSPRKALDEYASITIEWARKNPREFAVWMFFYSLAVNTKRFRDLNDNIREQGRNRISNLLYEGIAKKELPSTLAGRVPDLAAKIQGVITGMTIMAATESGFTYATATQKCLDVIESTLRK